MYLNPIILSTLASASLTFATPLEAKPKPLNQRAFESINANFEDHPNAADIALTPVGNYKHLNYNGFHVTTLGINGVYTTGIKAPSPYNVATYGLVARLQLGPPSITALNGDSFDLYSFYLGCGLNTQESVLGFAEECTVTLTGTSLYGRKVEKESFTFTPTADLSEFQRQTLGEQWRDLVKVEFETSKALLPATAFDNFVYDFYPASISLG